jgi:hypothetical protein
MREREMDGIRLKGALERKPDDGALLLLLRSKRIRMAKVESEAGTKQKFRA